MKILYIEDEQNLAALVKEFLEGNGFEVLHLCHGQNIINIMQKFIPDLCVLDVMLPQVDGFFLGKKIRSHFNAMPIIFLTAKSQPNDVVEGFESGGTDYLKKPFSLEELLVRIQNQLKLSQGFVDVAFKTQKLLNLGEVNYNPYRLELVFSNGKIIKLSNREAEILSFFAQNLNVVVDRKELLLSVWEDDNIFNSRNLDVYIKRLRNYFADSKGIEITTLKGKGYLFNVDH